MQQHLDRDREDLTDDERGPAEVTEWARIAQLLATTGGVYDPKDDAEREHAQQLEDEQRRQEQEAEAARCAALAPDVLLHTLARTGLMDSLREDAGAHPRPEGES